MKIKLTSTLLLLTSFVFGQSKPEKTDFTLQEAIDYALEYAYEIQDASDDIEQAEQQVRETKAIGLPQIDGSVSYQNYLIQQVSLIPAEINGGPAGEYIPITFNTKQNAGIGAELNQLIFDGSYLIGLKGIKVYLEGIEKAKIKTEFVVKEVVGNAYTYVLLVEENYKILQSNKAILEKNLRETQAMVTNGFSEEQDAEQIELNLSAIVNDIQNTETILASAYRMLNIALGIDVDIQLTLTETLESLMIDNIRMELVNQEFDIKNHIDYQISKTQKDYQELNVKYERSKNYPNIGAFINYNTSAFSDDFTFTDSDQQWFDSSLVGVQMNIPIFSSFQRNARTQQAKIELDKAERNLTVTEQNLLVQLTDAQNDYEYAIESYYVAKNNLDLAERIEKKTNIKYTEGLSSSFDLSNAQNQLYDKQRVYLESILYLINSRIKLENILNIK